MKLSRAIKTIVLLSIITFSLGFVHERAQAHTLGQVRRVSRRTGRRTTRRRMYALPAGHTTVVVSGATHYVVGGVHYVQQMESGKVVYVEVQS